MINSIHRDLQSVNQRVAELDPKDYPHTTDNAINLLHSLVASATQLAWRIGNENEVSG